MKAALTGWMNVSCSCGHTADLEEFTRRPLAGELPPGEFQCPACQKAWRVEKTPIEINRFGRLVSELNKIVATQARL